MADELNNDANEIEISDDLDVFEDQLFERTPPEAEEVEKEEVESDDGQKEDAPDGEADSTEDDSGKEAEPKKVNRFQERINELTAKAREAERALEALRAEQVKEPAPKTNVTPTPVVANEGPQPDDKNEDGSDKYALGEFDPNYIRDMARHTIDKEWAERKAQEAKETEAKQVQEARDQLQNQWVEKLTPVTEQHEDFLDKTILLEDTFSGLDPNYADYLVQTIKSLDHGPEVLYYFANHLDEAQSFVKMGPLNATLALGEINAMFKGNTRPDATKVSQAPIPPQVNRGSATRTSTAPDTDDLDAFSRELFKKRK